jgi:hypothetical protein
MRRFPLPRRLVKVLQRFALKRPVRETSGTVECEPSQATQRPVTPHVVAYYPRFETQKDLDNHFHRACWYLPRYEGVVEHVVLAGAPGLVPGKRVAHMCGPRGAIDHVQVIDGGRRYEEALAGADIILCWKDFDRAAERFPEATHKLLNVATEDVNAIEYGRYCSIHWRLMSGASRRRLLAGHHARFRKAADTIFGANPRSAVVFGTGPSIDRCYDFDFSGQVVIACNSIVRSDTIMDHIRPDFICAGDVVSHFGVSAYAARFREDLVGAIAKRKFWFLTTAQFGLLFMLQYPEVADRVILCDQTSDGPVFDLLRNWGLPKLDSTLNIHMLPLAATFSDRIFILGCDGKDADAAKNEDFWAHSSSAQYHDLVESGHLCHPTFDSRRQATTHDRYLESVRRTLEEGDRHGKIYCTLAPSRTPGLDTRYDPGSFSVK